MLELSEGDLEGVALRSDDPGCADHDVEAAELVHGRSERVLHRLFICYVERVMQRLTPAVGDYLVCRVSTLARVLPEVADGNRCAFGGKPKGHRAAEPGAAPGDKRNPAGESIFDDLGHVHLLASGTCAGLS